MRLQTLEIHNVRGIRHMTLRPEGRNVVIWGPNGSGKSAVIDALDFLLTGRMIRLMGEGTAGITLKRHGPHIDTSPKDAYVEAVVSAESGERVEIRRRLSAPGVVETSPSSPEVSAYLEDLKRGQYVLTRREILRFVTSDAGTRAEQMRILLNLVDMETTRKTLVNIKHRAERELNAAIDALQQAAARFAPILGVTRATRENVLEFVNRSRAELGAAAIPMLQGSLIKENVPLPSTTRTVPVTTKQLDDLAASLRDVCSPTMQAELQDNMSRAIKACSEIRSDPVLLREYRRRELLRLGLELLKDDGKCPLCDESWPVGVLDSRLRTAFSKASAVHSRVGVFDTSRNRACTILRTIAAAVDQLLTIVVRMPGALPQYRAELSNMRDQAKGLLAILSGDPETVIARPTLDDDFPMPVNDDTSRAVEAALSDVRGGAKAVAPQQEAWDALTRVEQVLALVEDAQNLVDKRQVVARRGSKLHAAFCKAQEGVLHELYVSIEERFTELYRELHGPDEGHFAAHLLPKEAGLNFEVDFYGRGSHPPHALHSEGHQDSMGVCLFLTLYERLAGASSNMVLLDDVVMSVDSEHRRQFARLLQTEFGDCQFIITTHDRTWASQLRTEGMVTSANMVQLFGWNVESGPRTLSAGDVLEQVEHSLSVGNVASAAATLRRGAEEFCQQVCERLRAPVRFSTTGQWELGDLAPAAVSRLRSLLKEAKRAANSWNQSDVLDDLAEIESTVAQTVARLQMESWLVNDSVHYNAWAAFSVPDFRPMVEAMRDFFDLFRCAQCQSLLNLNLQNRVHSAVKCACGGINWNLVARA
ncbi:MAG TPA: AAA family ATPase [Actinomycetota bacterium]|nr:AAA family ATPase [Actinomycetota bacterium]